MTPRQFLRIVLLLLAVALTVRHAPADPDLWGHVRFGQDMLSARAIRLPDTYSFTSDRPWVNHEWLAEVSMAAAFSAFGSAGLNLLRLAIVSIVLLLMWRRLRDSGANLDPTLLLSLAIVGIVLRVYPVRPQLFSVLLFTLLLEILTRVDEGASAWLLLFAAPLMAIWANLHGGWIVGCVTLVLWVAASAVSNRAMRHKWRALTVAVGVTLVATLANPYGLGLWRFLAATVGIGRPFVADWQPIYTLSPALWFTWLIPVGLTVLTLTNRDERIGPAGRVVVILLGVLSARVSRLDAFFTLSVVYFFGPALVRRMNAFSNRAPRSHASAVIRYPHRRRALVYAAAAGVVAFVVILAPSVTALEVRYPLMPEPEVADYVRSHHLRGRMVTWFDWGEYAIWHFSPDIKVSIDGRRETVYTDQLINRHIDFYAGTNDGWRYPDRVGADYVWIPKELGVASELESAGWRPLFVGPMSVLLARESADLPTEVVRIEPATRVFPGP